MIATATARGLVRVLTFVAIATTTWPAIAVGQTVLLRTNPPIQGLLRARANECFVLTSTDALGRAFDDIVVRGPAKSSAIAGLSREFPRRISLLRLKNGEGVRCAEWVDTQDLEQRQRATSGQIVIRDVDGQERQIAVSMALRPTDDEAMYVRAVSSDPLTDAMRGAPLVVDGVTVGMLLAVNDAEGRVYQIDDLMRLTAPFFTPTAARPRATVDDVAVAQAQLDRAIATRDGSVQGQVQAIATLLAAGHQFDNADWSGIALPSVAIAKASLRRARFHLADLTRLDARGADLADADFRFAQLDDGILTQAIMTRTRAPFASAQRTNWQGADLSGAYWFASDLRGATFTNAKLTGASLAFADLRGASFEGADLTGAYLGGALMDATTSFTNATFSSTDLIGATAASVTLSPAQRAGVCRHVQREPIAGETIGWDVRLITRSQTPDRADVLLESRSGFGNFSDRWMPICKTAPAKTEFFDPRFPGSSSLGLDAAMLRAGQRGPVVVERVKTTLALREKELLGTSNLQPDPALRDAWAKQLEEGIRRIEPETAHDLDPDDGVILMLRHGLIAPSGINWMRQASHRYLFELSPSYLGGSAQNARRPSRWPAIFPPLAPLHVLAGLGLADLFRGWTLARVKTAPSLLTVGEEFRPGQKRPLGLDNAGFRRFHTPAFAKHLKSAAIALDRAADNSSFDLLRIFEEGQPSPMGRVAVAVLPEIWQRYDVPVPATVEGGFRLEVDLAVDRVERFEKLLVLYVKPVVARAMRDGAVLWSGTLVFGDGKGRQRLEPDRR